MPWMRRYEIDGPSMEPALRPGDWVLVVRARRPPRRGDVVLVPHPTIPGREMVKRVVGRSGERVTIEAGRVTIGDDPTLDRWGRGPTMPDGSWLVPAGHVFVLGDHRVRSSPDSRAVGPTPVDAIAWRVLVRYGGRRHR